MNKTYKVVYNETTNTYTAVAEYAKSHGKSSSIVSGSLNTKQARITGVRTLFKFTAVMSGLLLSSLSFAAATTGTTTSKGTTVPNTTDYNTCYFDTASSSVVCGNTNTSSTGLTGHNSVAIGAGANTTVLPTYTGKSNTANNSVAIGTAASAGFPTSIAIGNNAGVALSSHVDQKNTPTAMIAIGDGAKAVGSTSTSIGYQAGSGSTGYNNIAIGNGAGKNNAGKTNVVIGTNAGNNLDKSISESVFIGQSAGSNSKPRATPYPDYIYAQGHSTYIGNAAGLNSIGDGNVGIGQLSGRGTNGSGNTFVGLRAGLLQLGDRNVSLGQDAGTEGNTQGMIAIGHSAGSLIGRGNTRVSRNTNIGEKAMAYNDDAIAIGTRASAGEANSSTLVSDIAIGTGTVAQGKNSTAIGSGMATTTAESTQNGDIISETILKNGASATGISSIAIGGDDIQSANAMGNYAIAIGAKSQVSGDESISIGKGNIVSGNQSGAIGDPSYVFGDGSYTYGNDNVVGKESFGGFAFGSNNQLGATVKYDDKGKTIGGTITTDATGKITDASGVTKTNAITNSSAVGNYNYINTSGTYVLGSGINTVGSKDSTELLADTVKNSVYLGDDSTVTDKAGSVDITTGKGTLFNAQKDSVADGSTTTGGATGTVSTATVNGVTYGGFAGNTAVGAVTVGASGAERRIQNVAAGEISSTSTDAINGSQLYFVADELSKKISAPVAPENYFHVNPSTNPVAARGKNNLDAVNGIGNATGGEALTAGVDASAAGRVSVAVGKNTRADNYGGIAIGENARASSYAGTAEQYAAFLQKIKDGVFDPNSANYNANDPETAAYNTYVAAQTATNGESKSIAIGGGAQATRSKAIAVGDLAIASGEQSFAMGSQALASGRYATAMGSNSIATGDFSTAVGKSATASGSHASAMGVESVAAGNNSLATGRQANASGSSSTAIGVKAAASATRAVALGSKGAGEGTKATANDSIAIGTDATATQVHAIATGSQAKATGGRAIATGELANASANYAIATGANSVASAQGATALGRNTQATLENSVALGAYATTREGNNTTSATVNGVSYSGFAGVLPEDKKNRVVSVGGVGGERQIQNVAAGEISATSTDAINGSQLYLVTQGTLDQMPVVYTKADGTKVFKQPDGTFKDADGNEVPADDVIASMNNPQNSTTTPMTLTNIEGNLDGAKTGTTAPTTVGTAPANVANISNNAATVGDVLNAGWNLQDNGEAKDFVKPYDTVNFINGTGTTAVVTTARDGKSSTVTYNVNADNKTTEITYVNAAGDTVYAITDALGNVTYNTAKDGSGSQVNAADIKGSQISATIPETKVNGTNVTDPVNLVDGDTTTVTNTPNGIKVEVKTANITNNPNGAAVAPTTDGIATAKNVADAINNSGWNLQANGDTASLVKPSNTVQFLDGKNIEITRNGNDITIATADDVEFNTVKSNEIAVNPNGTFIIGTNATVDMGGNKITNVAAGTDATDAVNVSQLNQAVSGLKTTVSAGDNMVVTSSTNADGSTNYTVATAKDVKFDSVNVGDTVNISNTGINAGNTKVTGVAAGDISVDSTDAVNGAQIYALTGGQPTNVSNVTITNADGTTSTVNNVIVDENGKPVLKTYNVEGQTEYITNSVVTAINNMNEQGIKFFHVNDGQNYTEQGFNGIDSSASGEHSAAIGYQTKATGKRSVAMGYNSQATGESAIAIGDKAQATGAQSIAIGTGNIVSGNNSGALGAPNTVTGNDSYAFGNNNTISTSNTFVMGNNVTQTADNSVVLGNNSAIVAAGATTAGTTGTVNSATVNGMTYSGFAGATANGAVSVGAVGDERRIQNVAAGEISSTSTDAINGSQLYAVAKATAAASPIQYSDSNNPTAPNGGTATNDVTLVGGDTNAPVTIHNVAPGVAGTDAVNVNQLNQGLNNLNNRIDDVADDAFAGVAGAIAQGSIPQATRAGATGVGVGTGYYGGQSAIAVGVSALSDSGNWIVKGNFSGNSQGRIGVGLGALYQW